MAAKKHDFVFEAIHSSYDTLGHYAQRVAAKFYGPILVSEYITYTYGPTHVQSTALTGEVTSYVTEVTARLMG